MDQTSDAAQQLFLQRYHELVDQGADANEAAAQALLYMSAGGGEGSGEGGPGTPANRDGAREEMETPSGEGEHSAAATPAAATPADMAGSIGASMEVEEAVPHAQPGAGEMETEGLQTPAQEGPPSKRDAAAAAVAAPVKKPVAKRSATADPHDWMSGGVEPPSAERVDCGELARVAAECVAGGDYSELQSLVHKVFSDPAALVQTFLKASDSPSSSSSDPPTTDLIRVDLPAVDEAYRAVISCAQDSVEQILLEASRVTVERLNVALQSTPNEPSTLRGAPFLRALVILLANPILAQRVTSEAQDLLHELYSVTSQLPGSGRRALAVWVARCSENQRFDGWVKAIQQFITLQILQLPSYTGVHLRPVNAAVKALSILHAANALAIQEDRGEKAPYTEFYNDAINEELFDVRENKEYVEMAYRDWIRDQSSSIRRPDGADSMPESLISYPFVITAATKASILQIDARHQMSRGMNQELFNAIFGGQRIVPYLVLRVRRNNIVQDTLTRLNQMSRNELKKPLKVIFEGEEGIDEGGVQKEFMQVVTRELLDPAYGMFKVDEDTRQLYFNPHTFELGLEFELIGTLVGVAIYNSIILDIPFPMVVYKRLKGMRPTLQDLIDAQPALGRSLKVMLNFDGNVETTFSQVFQVSYEVWGGIQTQDLKPSGGDIAVTNENVKEYVDLYVDWALAASVEKQYSAFEKGFLRVCGGEALNIFQPEELELLVCGNPVLDFDALQRVTQYDDGFTEDSPTIQQFWSVVHRFTEEEKRLLLKFATGSDRAPINGLASLTFVISKNGSDSERLPTSHTCFNHLLLPEYATEEKLEDKLKRAIHQAEGFGLR